MIFYSLQGQTDREDRSQLVKLYQSIFKHVHPGKGVRMGKAWAPGQNIYLTKHLLIKTL